MKDIVIEARGISKKYRLGLRSKKGDTFARKMYYALKSPFDNFKRLARLSRFDESDPSVFWALRDVEFSVKQGEVMGVIGHNGAGKSTLLKILSRITEPTSGEIAVKGRVSSLLEVGTGFHPELTGRENVYMNGTILGMRKREIDKKFDEIISFSGINEHIDTPVKFYSSGMKVRLGFSVAAHLEPDILIVDEVLAVGDVEFQKKCISMMGDVARSGRTIIFVSHDMAAVSLLCTQGMYLKKGKVDYIGSIDSTIKHYFTVNKAANILGDREDRDGNQKLTFTNIRLINSKGEITRVIDSGEKVTIQLSYKRHSTISSEKLLLSLNLYDANTNALISYLASDEQGFDRGFALLDEGDIYFTIDHLPLRGGSYYFSIYSAEVEYSGVRHDMVDCIQRALEFDVLPVDYWGIGKINRKKGILINTRIFGS